MSYDFKKLDSFTLETSKNQRIRSFLRNGHLRVNTSEHKFMTLHLWNLCTLAFNSETILIEKAYRLWFPTIYKVSEIKLFPLSFNLDRSQGKSATFKLLL